MVRERICTNANSSGFDCGREKPAGKILAVYKEKGITSHDVVDRIRRVTGEKKVGHAGTLDPLAEGVLVVGIGPDATKKLGQFSQKEKEYVAVVKLGYNSSTDDAEGYKQKVEVEEIPARTRVVEVLSSFEGLIRQRPPLFSAVKVGGRRAYKLARAKKKFELPERQIVINQIKLLNYDWPLIKIKAVTGPGVYIRALARDIGQKLGTGAYLAQLVRTRVGDFTKEKAFTLSQLKAVYQT